MAKNEPKRYLLDTSAFLGIIVGDSDCRSLTGLLEDLENGEAVLVASTVLLTEAMPEHAGDLEPQKRRQMLDMLKSGDVELIDVSTPIAELAGRLRVELDMKSIDAIHLATAIQGRVDTLIVRDRAFPYPAYGDVEIIKPADYQSGRIEFPEP